VPSLDGKTCFVTGAGQGIGRSVADAFLKAGAHVIAADLAASELHWPRDERFRAVALDVTDRAALSAVAARHSDVDILVNCVGQVASNTVLTCAPEDLERSFRLNVVAMAQTISAFLPAMVARGSGNIVNVASVVSDLKAAPNRFAYATTKAAVLGLTKSVACDFIGKGIRCNAVSPGTIDTPSLRDRIALAGDAEAARRAFIARQPMGRLGTADEVAAVILMLAADASAFMTGANIVIDGGMSL
jgi:2-keto-3-deoxy-L-fuconate dehydrogenase